MCAGSFYRSDLAGAVIGERTVTLDMVYDTAVRQSDIFSADRIALKAGSFERRAFNIFYRAELSLFCKPEEAKVVAVC